MWLLLPALALLSAAFLLPVGWLLSRAFTQPHPGFGNFVTLLERPVYLRVLWNTVVISAIVTPVCVVLGYPVAHAMAFGSPQMRRVLVFLALLPLWTSLLVRCLATSILLQRHGPLNMALLSLGLIHAPLPLLYGLGGLVIGAVQTSLPFVILPLYATMLSIDRSLMQAAFTLGAGPVRAFWRVYLPQTWPGILAGGTLVFIGTLGYYIVPAMLGGPRQTMIAQMIQDQIASFGNWGMAGTLSLALLAITAVLLALLQATLGVRAIAR